MIKVEYNKEEAVFENSHYWIRIGESTLSPDPTTCYQLINKKYKIIESESTVLPVAVSNAEQFADGVDEINEMDNELVVPEKDIITLN